MKVRVYYEDTDVGGIVYHTNYIKYCERARSEVFFQKGLIPSQSHSSGFVVRNLDANFLATSTLGDMLSIKSKILKLKSSSLILLQEIWKEDIKVFRMQIILVYIDKGKPRRIPEEFRDIFKSF